MAPKQPTTSHPRKGRAKRSGVLRFLAPSAGLSASERLIVILHHFEGMDFKAIASMLQITPARVRELYESILQRVKVTEDQKKKLVKIAREDLKRRQRGGRGYGSAQQHRGPRKKRAQPIIVRPAAAPLARVDAGGVHKPGEPAADASAGGDGPAGLHLAGTGPEESA